MSARIDAYLLSIGEEVVAGDIVDTNAAELSRRLKSLGLQNRGVEVVGDRTAEIARAIREAAGRARVVLATGGLGPTRDDLTRDALALALEEPLIEDSDALRAIQAFFDRVGRRMSDSNRIQALRPRSAEMIPNPVGTAPGLCARIGETVLFFLPGVPFEMRRMIEEFVVPRLRQLGLAQPTPPRILVRAHGIPESVVGERIAEFMGEANDPYVGVTVSGGILSVSITGRTVSEEVSARVEAIADEIERRLGEHVFGRGDVTLESATLAAVRGAGSSLAVAESCTGGRVAAALTGVAGSSDVFLGGVVAYSNAVKQSQLGVPAGLLTQHGAVSEPVARAMARGVATALGARIAVAVTGVAGPGGGTASKPVGMVCFGTFQDGVESSVTVTYGGERDVVQQRAARHAIDLIRLAAIRSRTSARV